MAWHREESQVRADLSQNARKKNGIRMAGKVGVV